MLEKIRNIGLVVLIVISWGLTPAATTDFSYLALGDSYTIGESVTVADRYPVQAVGLLKTARISCQAPEIIATTGWTTANLLDALAYPTARTSYDVVTLLIGVNNQFQGRSQAEYSEQFTALLQQSIRLAANKPSHVLVLSIPDYSVTPFARSHNTARIAAEIDSFNIINATIAQNYKVHYLDITGESRKAMEDPSLIAADGLHFSGKEYAVWATMMEPVMKEALSK